MWIALEQAPVHVGAGIALVRVHDDVLRVAGGVMHGAPLPAGRESAAPASPQTRPLDLVDHRFGIGPFEHVGEGLVSADCDVVVDQPRIEAGVVLHEEPLLVLVEGDVVEALDASAVLGMLVEEPLDRAAAAEGLLDDLGHVRRGDPEIAGPRGEDHDDGTALAEPVATRPPDGDLAGDPGPLDLALEGGDDVVRSAGDAARARADGHAGPLRIAVAAQPLSQLVQLVGRINS